MRLFVPNYELARRHLEKALEDGVIEKLLPEGYHYQDQLQAVIDFILETQS
jgi:hypothetical protein